MPYESKLYSKAVETATPLLPTTAIDTLHQQMLDHDAALLENLMAEAHLAPSDDINNCCVLRDFLVEASNSAQSPTEHFPSIYAKLCGKYKLQGYPIPLNNLPQKLLTYSSNISLLGTIISKFLTDTDRINFIAGNFQWDDLFDRLQQAWRPIDFNPSETLKFDKSSIIFATFETDSFDLSIPPIKSAGDAAMDLALPQQWEIQRGVKRLFVFEYESTIVENPRFPTIADVGLYTGFKPAPDNPPTPDHPKTWWGWTKPNPHGHPRPEIVHSNICLTKLSIPPRLLPKTL